jgi:hypothetical protein
MKISFRSIFAAVFLSASSAFGFSVDQQVEASEDPILKPNGTPIAAGEFVVKVGYFNYNTSNFNDNNAQVQANLANTADLESHFVQLFQSDGTGSNTGANGVNTDFGPNVNGPGTILTYFRQPDNVWASTYSGFSGKKIYAWFRLKSDPQTQAIFADDTISFAGGTNEITDSFVNLYIAKSIPTLRIIAGEAASNGIKLVQAATTATLSFSAGTATVREDAGTVTLTVNRTGKMDNSVSVKYATADGTAQSPADYIGVQDGTLSFAAGESSKTIIIPIVNRTGFQPSRNFSVTLSEPSTGAELGTPSTVTVTITDKDQPQRGVISLSSNSYTVSENGGSATITVTRTGGSDGEVSASFATSDNGDATAGQDYTAVSQTVTFADGDSASKQILIPITDDTTFEGDEVFLAGLSSPTGGATLGTSSATVTITEDDAVPPGGSVSFSSSTYSVQENGGTVTITVNRSGGSNGNASVQYSTSNGSASAGADYETASGTLEWADGESGAKSFTVTIINNSNDQPDKNFNVALSSSSGSISISSPASAVVTIVDEDTAGSIQFQQTTATVAENGGPVTLTLTRSGGSDGQVTVRANTGGGTATPNTDYTPLTNEVITFGNGQTSASLNIQITNNATFSGNRTFDVTLSDPSNSATLGANSTATVTITEDEQPKPGVFNFNSASYFASEGAAKAVITVTRSGGSDQETTVRYSMSNGTAIAADYVNNSGTLTFPQGKTSAKFTVTIINDGTPESNETVNLRLTNPTNGARLGSRRTAVLTIVNDDQPAVFRVESDSYNVVEGSPATVKVIRSGGTGYQASVRYYTSDNTAFAGSDYTANKGVLTFAPDETEKTITLDTEVDETPEADEVFNVALGRTAESSSARLVHPLRTAITITRNNTTEQPDGMIVTSQGTVGDNIYNSTASGQTSLRGISGGSSVDYSIRIQNDGDAADTVVLTGLANGTATNGTVQITFDGNDITEEVLSSSGFETPEFGVKKSHQLQVTVGVSGGKQYVGYGVTITATSMNNSAKTDAVKVGVFTR